MKVLPERFSGRLHGLFVLCVCGVGGFMELAQESRHKGSTFLPFHLRRLNVSVSFFLFMNEEGEKQSGIVGAFL